MKFSVILFQINKIEDIRNQNNNNTKKENIRNLQVLLST